jgi:prevent-host-death family protein
MKTITAAEANRRFSELLRAVATGETVEVVSRGRPVAQISSVDVNKSAREAARTALLRRLRAQRSTSARNWHRGGLYEDNR